MSVEREQYERCLTLAERLWKERDEWHASMINDMLRAVYLTVFCMIAFAAMWLFQMPWYLYPAVGVVCMIGNTFLIQAAMRAQRKRRTWKLATLDFVASLREVTVEGTPLQKFADRTRLARFSIKPES